MNIDSCSNLFLHLGSVFDGEHLVPDGAKLFVAVLLRPGHDVAAGGLHVVDHLLEVLLLVIEHLVLGDAGLLAVGLLGPGHDTLALVTCDK